MSAFVKSANATVLVALIADIRRFPSGRQFASFFGLTPKEDSQGPDTAAYGFGDVRLPAAGRSGRCQITAASL